MVEPLRHRQTKGAGTGLPSLTSPRHISTLPIHDIASTSQLRRVGVWRSGFRLSMSVAAPFVWRCLSGSAVAPFPHPPHR